MELINCHRCFGGEQRRYKLESRQLNSTTTVGVFLPPDALKPEAEAVPVLIWLSGLTCNDENAVHKAGAQRHASELGLALVMPDTSPRGDDVPGDPQGQWDFGHGAGFYVDAEAEPWSLHYQMHSFVVAELISALCTEIPLDEHRLGISGHSMGGHGALVLGLRHPGLYRSVSAVAPIAHPGQCPWGRKAFSHLLGTTPEALLKWRRWDAVSLLEDGCRRNDCLLVDIGSADPFLEEQLLPEELRNACASSGQQLELMLHEGYDHSYFFVASVIDRHLDHHARALTTNIQPAQDQRA